MTTTTPPNPQTQSGVATSRDGIKLSYTLRSANASAQRPRIALVHSLAMDRSFWDPVAQLLAPMADVLTYDCRGHGQSDKPKGPYSNTQFANDLADLCHHVKWADACVAGASMGGAVALGFAVAYPEITRGLGLIDTTAWYGADAPKNWADRANKAQSEGMAALLAFQKTRWFCEEFSAQNPQVLQRCIDVFVENDINAFVATCQMMGAFDLRSKLSTVTAKTAIAVGEEDYATPLAMAQVMHEGITGSSLQIIPKARHLTPLEKPQDVAKVLLSIL